jgi:hypothetical protein
MNDGCAAGSFDPSGAMRPSADSTRFQKNLNLNRQRTIATKAKIAVISPPTTQKPFGLPLNGMAPDVYAPNARDQCCRQEYHREHREYVKVAVGFFLDLRPQLFEQELTVLRVLLRILDQSRIAMDLAVKSVEFFGRKQHRTLARQLEHGRALVGHVAGDPD